MSLNSFSNWISWLPITCSKSKLILTCCRFFLEPKLIFINCSSLRIIHPAMRRFWTLIQARVSSISNSPISCYKNVFNKFCWKVSSGIAILTCRIGTNLIGINETSGLDTCSTGLITWSIKFKPVIVINLKDWFDQIEVRITMVPIEIILVMWQTWNPPFHQIF